MNFRQCKINSCSGFIRSVLAKSSNVHYSNIGRYERGDAKPSAEVLNRIAQALDTSPDYLINGTLQDKAENMISDNELLIMFKKVEKLPKDKKRLVKCNQKITML